MYVAPCQFGKHSGIVRDNIVNIDERRTLKHLLTKVEDTEGDDMPSTNKISFFVMNQILMYLASPLAI